MPVAHWGFAGQVRDSTRRADSTFLWSIASFGAAITPSLGGFFAARFLLGVGEAPTFPANAKAIGHWFPSRERSFATSVFDGAAKFASAIGVPLHRRPSAEGRMAMELRGYRSDQLSVFSSVLANLSRSAGRPGTDQHEREYIRQTIRSSLRTKTGQASLGYLLRQRKVIGMVLGFGSYNYVFYLLLTWLPSYLSSALHIDLLHSFLYTGVPWLIATVADLASAAGWWMC